jgi:hypothetical protein
MAPGARVGAFDVGEDLYRITNPPCFVWDLAVGDTVHCVAAGPGTLPVFQRLQARSDHVTLRVVCFRAGPLVGRLQPVIDPFAAYGVWAEGVEQYGMSPSTSHPHVTCGPFTSSWLPVRPTAAGSGRRAGSPTAGSTRLHPTDEARTVQHSDRWQGVTANALFQRLAELVEEAEERGEPMDWRGVAERMISWRTSREKG